MLNTMLSHNGMLNNNAHSSLLTRLNYIDQHKQITTFSRIHENHTLTIVLISSSNILLRLSSLLLVCSKSAFFLSIFLFLSLLSFSRVSSSANYKENRSAFIKRTEMHPLVKALYIVKCSKSESFSQ